MLILCRKMDICSLSGPIPPDISNLSQLQILYVLRAHSLPGVKGWTSCFSCSQVPILRRMGTNILSASHNIMVRILSSY